MKKFTSILIAPVMCLVIMLTPYLFASKQASAATNPNQNSHVIYYIPHQDDEAINFAVGILNDIQAGYNVHLVLLTDGSAAIVIKKLGMTKQEFSAARDREFAYAVNIMGVKPQNVSYQKLQDGATTVKQIESVIRAYEKKYPKAKHKAYSYTDWHNDHKNSGQALKNLKKAKVISNATFYIRFGDNPTGLTATKEPFSPIYKNFILAVSNAYKMENHRLGFYGIGWKSAGHLFKEVEKQPLSRYHK